MSGGPCNADDIVDIPLDMDDTSACKVGMKERVAERPTCSGRTFANIILERDVSDILHSSKGRARHAPNEDVSHKRIGIVREKKEPGGGGLIGT